jgi:hypothetical protein
MVTSEEVLTIVLFVKYEYYLISEQIPRYFFLYLYMTKANIYKLDFEVGRLTDSILNKYFKP